MLSRCPCFHVRRAARVLTSRLDGALGSTGLRATQFEILGALAASPTAPTVRSVAETISLEASAVSRAIAALVRRGLVRVEPGAADRRERVVVLTAPGKRAYRAGLPQWETTCAALANEVGKRDAEAVAATLALVSVDPKA